ncbi:MAG: PEP-CTERM-box response regulator transcription factor [Candidatus Polarisedimenticolaceae bacterium]|nr:PEP-CTERM-box response regulator transcription factor [Candidatus Polarisedimenticolaceae bacterium]
MKPLLIIEDDLGLQSQLKWCFEDYQVEIAGDRESGIAALKRIKSPVVTLDLGLPPDPTNASEGMQALKEILAIAPDTKVIVVTGNEDRANALEAITFGAYDFYQKPIDSDVLKVIIDRAYQLHEIEAENKTLLTQQSHVPLKGVIANSPEMMALCKIIEKISPTNVTTLILGESGTGKEVIARAIHDLSDRKGKSFIAINCASIPDNLLESELFGFEKGAFTGAVKKTLGKIEIANGGTLFLDEIGDMPIALQAKLLRFLQERIIERIGGREEIPVDVRVLCATHQHLDQMIQEGGFREDLYYRVSEIVINIPALRERMGDAVLLAWSFLEKFRSVKSNVKGFTNDALLAIEGYSWPGNVRELENRIRRATILAEGSLITAQELQLEEALDEVDATFALREVRERAEVNAVLRVLSHAEGNISRAAELLEVSRPTLYDLMNKYNLK